MATTYTLKSDSYQGRYLQLDCTQEKDISRNVSVIKWTLKTVGQDGTYYTTGPTTAKINGKQVYYKARTSYSSAEFPAKAGSVSGTTEVSHDSTGKATISVSLSTAIYTSSVTTKSGSWTLDDIPRQATLTAAPNFTDEQNPTITYSNPAGNAVTSLKACIADSRGVLIYAGYRDIPKTGNSYTFNLDTEERNALRFAMLTSNTLKVKFYVTTVIGGTTFYSSQEKEMTIVNADPIIAPTAKDTGSTSVPLTGDANNKVIKGFNYMDVAVNATPNKGAGIVSQSITCGSQKINGGSGGLNNVESGTFVFTATDTRGNTTSKPLTKELIPYVKLTCNLDVANPTTDGKTKVSIKGNYYSGSFGATSNTLAVSYRYKENNGSFGAWTAVTAKVSGSTYSFDTELTGLNYQSSYTFEAKAADKCITVYTPAKVVKSTPVFDWGENDFKFNVPAYDNFGQLINKKNNDLIRVVLGSNVTMPSGAYTIIPFSYAPEQINENNSFWLNGSTGGITITSNDVKKVRVYVSVLDYAWGSDTMYLTVNKNGNILKRVYLRGQCNIHIETEISVKKDDIITSTFYCGVEKVLPANWEYTQMVVSVS